MTINLSQDVLQHMLNTALATGRQDAMNHINALLGGMPGGSQIVGYVAGVRTYSTPNPIPTPAVATGQPAAQQPVGQQPAVLVARVRNEVHPPDRYDGRKDGYESFRRHLVQYINYVDATCKVNTALSSFNKGTADAWGRHYFTINERTILAGSHTMEDFLEAADKYFRDPRLEERARQAILQTVPNRARRSKHSSSALMNSWSPRWTT